MVGCGFTGSALVAHRCCYYSVGNCKIAAGVNATPLACQWRGTPFDSLHSLDVAADTMGGSPGLSY